MKLAAVFFLLAVVMMVEVYGESAELEKLKTILSPVNMEDVEKAQRAAREKRSFKGFPFSFPFPFPFGSSGYIGNFGGLKGYKGIGFGLGSSNPFSSSSD